MPFAATWQLTKERVERLAARSGRDWDWVRQMLFVYDWPNQAEHKQWVEVATDEELIDWLLALDSEDWRT